MNSAHREAARLAVRDSRRERRIEGVDVDRNVHRLAQRRTATRDPGTHVDHLDPVTLGLGALHRGQRADAHLHQSIGQALFHDPGEGTRMRVPIALELRVQVGMGVEVQDTELRMKPSHGPHDRVGDRMVAAERDRPASRLEQRADRLFDLRPRVRRGGAERHVTRVAEGTVRAQIDPRLGPRVSRGRVQRLADHRRSGGRAPEKGGARVVGEAEQSRGAANRTGHVQKQVGEGGRYMRPEPLLPTNAPPARVDRRRQRIEPAQEGDDLTIWSNRGPAHPTLPCRSTAHRASRSSTTTASPSQSK